VLDRLSVFFFLRELQQRHKMSRELTRKARLKAVSWVLIYALYILMSVGLIIASAITLRFGDAFFGNTAAATSPSGTGGTTASGAGNGGDGGDAEDTDAANGAAGAAALLNAQRLHAQARSGVVSSVGVALVSLSKYLML
jgi:hypothetical protein